MEWLAGFSSHTGCGRPGNDPDQRFMPSAIDPPQTRNGELRDAIDGYDARCANV
jgi:hypothetical protein